MTTETVVVTEPTVADKALAASGATIADLDPSAVAAVAPKAPVDPGNTVPEKKGDDEVNTVVLVDPVKKAADDAAAKVVADKAAADAAEAAGPLKSYAVINDSPAAAAAIDLLKEAGVGPNAANEFFAKALASGNLADIDVAGLETKLGKSKATLVMTGVTAHFNQVKAQGEATVKLTHEIFGGETNWNTVRDWAKTAEKTDTALKTQIDDIRSLLDEGGARAQAGARELLRMYNAAPQTKGLGNAKLAIGDSTGTVVGVALSRADYLAELKAAHAKGATSVTIKNLDARRMAGKRAGI